MRGSDAYAFFFQIRWPNGFVCPRCGHNAAYTVATRSAPLYQCRHCRHQTTLTAGTVMERSRTPLAKWAFAFSILASTNGVNAVELSNRIGVSHKTAWNMLRKIREAIGRIESERKLEGIVQAGLLFLGARNVQPFVSHPQERAVLAGAAIDSESGQPAVFKLVAVSPRHLRGKRLTSEGVAHFSSTHIRTEASLFALLRMVDLHWRCPLKSQFWRASRWLNRHYRGIGTKYLQSYLNEYCFRYNAASNGQYLGEVLLDACVSRRTKCVASRSYAHAS